MLRSLPSGSRIIPAFLLTFLTTLFLYRLVFTSGASSGLLSADQCDIDGNCQTDHYKNLNKPPTRQEFIALQNSLNSLKNDLETLRNTPPPKELTQDEKIWESKRTQCSTGVLRNIDYQHVPSNPEDNQLTVERGAREILGSGLQTILDPRTTTMEILHR